MDKLLLRPESGSGLLASEQPGCGTKGRSGKRTHEEAQLAELTCSAANTSGRHALVDERRHRQGRCSQVDGAALHVGERPGASTAAATAAAGAAAKPQVPAADESAGAEGVRHHLPVASNNLLSAGVVLPASCAAVLETPPGMKRAGDRQTEELMQRAASWAGTASSPHAAPLTPPFLSGPGREDVTASALPVMGAPASGDGWVYTDAFGRQQGPFSVAELRGWLESRFMYDSTLVCPVQGGPPMRLLDVLTYTSQQPPRHVAPEPEDASDHGRPSLGSGVGENNEDDGDEDAPPGVEPVSKSHPVAAPQPLQASPVPLTPAVARFAHAPVSTHAPALAHAPGSAHAPGPTTLAPAPPPAAPSAPLQTAPSLLVPTPKHLAHSAQAAQGEAHHQHHQAPEGPSGGGLKEWAYAGLQGEEVGPFSMEQLLAGLHAGSLSGELPIYRLLLAEGAAAAGVSANLKLAVAIHSLTQLHGDSGMPAATWQPGSWQVGEPCPPYFVACALLVCAYVRG
eukprot:jgi/Mesen1/5339/ME000267S04484